MKRTLFTRCLALCLALAAACSAYGRQPIKALLVTGQNNHHWQVSHVVLERILEQSGCFAVDCAVSPPAGERLDTFLPDFAAYDVVLLDYNGAPWSAAAQQRFEAYAAAGGGIVVYHAADNAFPHWAAYNRICALGGWEGRDERSGPYVYWQDSKLVRDSSPGAGGSHGKQHAYLLQRRDADHPITRGLPDRWMHAKDELYDRMRGPGNIASLLYTAYSDPATGGSGREEPLVFTVDYGKARIFHIMLGHAGERVDDCPSMQCAGFQTLLLRGAEWAATGEVTQPVPADFPGTEQPRLRPDYR